MCPTGNEVLAVDVATARSSTPTSSTSMSSLLHPGLSREGREALARQLIINLAQVVHEMRNTAPSSPAFRILRDREAELALRLRARQVAVSREPEPLITGPVAAECPSPASPAVPSYDELVTQVRQLGQAVVSRTVIGQAQGILMERHKITADQAFDRLKDGSQHLNRKLRDIAATLVATGEELNRPPRHDTGSDRAQ